MRVPRFVKRWQRARAGHGGGSAGVGAQVARVSRSVSIPFRAAWLSVTRLRKSRSLRNFWLGLPALLVAVLAVVGGVAAKLKSSSHEGLYRKLALQSYRDGDFARARVYLERVYRAGGADKESRFFLAAVLDGQGESQRAQAMVDALSPDEGFGYPDAHYLKLKVLLDCDSFATKDQAVLAFHHLEATREKYENVAEWLFLKAKFLLMVGQTDEALVALRSAARLDASLQFDLAKVYERVGQGDEARSALQQASLHYETVLGRDSRSHDVRLNLAAVLTRLGSFDRAYVVLEEGLAVGLGDKVGPAMATVALAQYDVLLRDGDVRPMDRLALLQSALKYDRGSKEAARRLAFFGEEGGVTPDAQRAAIRFLEAMVASGEGAAIAHFALGSKASRDGDQENAVFHLGRAYALDKSMVVMANNFAWALSHSGESKLDEALEVIDSVLASYPEVPEFRDTRGQILLKMGKWDKALADLEFALRSNPRDPDIHAGLSNVYRQIHPAQEQLSKTHARIAKSLRSSQGG